MLMIGQVAVGIINFEKEKEKMKFVKQVLSVAEGIIHLLNRMLLSHTPAPMGP